MEAQSSTSLAIEPTQEVSSHHKRDMFYYISEQTWDALRAFHASERTPDFPKRFKEFALHEANIWHEFITNNLAPWEIRNLVIELHKKLYPGRTLFLDNLRERTISMRVTYVIKKYMASVRTPPAGTATHTGTSTTQAAAQSASHVRQEDHTMHTPDIREAAALLLHLQSER